MGKKIHQRVIDPDAGENKGFLQHPGLQSKAAVMQSVCELHIGCPCAHHQLNAVVLLGRRQLLVIWVGFSVVQFVD